MLCTGYLQRANIDATPDPLSLSIKLCWGMKWNMHGTWCKTQFISEKLTVKTWDNGRQHPPKLKPLLDLEQSLPLRLGGSGVASMFALCRYPVHSILLYPYVLRVSWLIPICSEWWGLFFISSLALSSWRTEQPSPECFPSFPVQVRSQSIS